MLVLLPMKVADMRKPRGGMSHTLKDAAGAERRASPTVMKVQNLFRCSVVPAQAGTQAGEEWIPAYAGMTSNVLRYVNTSTVLAW